MNRKVLFGVMRFKDFICESLKPKKVNFGTDLVDGEWKKLDQDFHVTYFVSSQQDLMVVIYRKGHIGFGVAKKSNVDVSSIEVFDDVVKNFYLENTKSKAAFSAMRIFNEVIYVILDIIKVKNPDEIYFNGSTNDLVEFYSTITKDRNFVTMIKQNGYEYVGLESNKGQSTPVHTFKRIV